eukprot:360599-Chlamydomonas_euryale.AAC.2
MLVNISCVLVLGTERTDDSGGLTRAVRAPAMCLFLLKPASLSEHARANHAHVCRCRPPAGGRQRRPGAAGRLPRGAARAPAGGTKNGAKRGETGQKAHLHAAVSPRLCSGPRPGASVAATFRAGAPSGFQRPYITQVM